MAARIKPSKTAPRNDLTAEYVRSLFDYDPTTGALVWKRRSALSALWNAKYAGKRAGNLNKIGYRSVCIDYRRYYEHRLVWLHYYGAWPAYLLDHVNGTPDDNRIINLREAVPSENLWNRSAKKPGSLKGVSLDPRCNMWAATICKNYKRTYLGYFRTPEEAHAAYVEASKQLHGQFSKT